MQSGQLLQRLNRSMSQHQHLLLRVKNALPLELAEHCVAANLSTGQLTIFADSPVWASRLRYAVKILADQLPCKALEIRRIRVGIHYRHRRPASRPPRPPAKLSEANSRLIRQVAEHIQDPDLRRSLERLSRHR